MAAASKKILLPLPPRKNKQLTETIPATDNTQISIANITKLQLDIRQHEQKISEMKDNLILLLQEHLMSKLTYHSQPQAVSDPFSIAPPPQPNAFPASGHISQSLIASSLTLPLQLSASPASGHISQPPVACSISAEHFASHDFNKSVGTSTQQQPHNITAQPHAAPEQLSTQQQGTSQFAQQSAAELNIPAICDSKIQIDATTLSLCTNPGQSPPPMSEQSSSPQTLPDERSMQRQMTTLEFLLAGATSNDPAIQIQNARRQDENEKFIREAPQHKQEEIRQVLKLGEEADKIMYEIDELSSSAAQRYRQILNILPQHAQSLCNYAFFLQIAQGRTEEHLNESEELYKKAVQAEPHRPATLFNYARYLHARGRVQEGCDMYARAVALEPTNPAVLENGHLFNNARLSNPVQHTRHAQTTPKTQSRRNLQVHLSKTCRIPTDDQPICLLYTKHGQCRYGRKCKFKHVHKESSANQTECSPCFSTTNTLLSQPPTLVPTAKPAMLISTLLTNNASAIHITTPKRPTLSQSQLEKVQKHAVQLADVLRKVTAKQQMNVETRTMRLTLKANVLSSLLEQDCEDCDTLTTHKVTSMLNRTIDLDKFSCLQQLSNELSADTIKDELRSLGLKCGGTISERANRLWATKNIRTMFQIPQEMLASTQSESKKKHKPKIVDNDDMTQWPTLQDWQVVRARDSSNSHIDTIKSVWEKGRPSIIPTVNLFEILNSTSP